MTATKMAFARLRQNLGEARLPRQDLIKNQGETIQMNAEDGLLEWVDGTQLLTQSSPPTSPVITAAQMKSRMLWVVRAEDVVYAPENGPFGKTLESKVIKHTNLTGGALAFSGGEVIFLEGESAIAVNGDSGRYGPRSIEELDDVVTAFARSGYSVWAMGYDLDADRPLPFFPGAMPQWVP